MAGVIEFAPNFAEESGGYVLFEFPPELREQLKQDKKLAIKERKNESYIIGEDKLYHVIKYQISNLMLASEVDDVPMSESQKYQVKSFQQSYLIPTVIRPFVREILIYLKAIVIEEGESLIKPDLKADFLKDQFVTNDKFLRKVLDEMGADIVGDYVINLSNDYKRLIFNMLLGKIVDKGLLIDKNSIFSLQDIGIGETGDDTVLARTVMKHYYRPIQDMPDRYSFSLKGAVYLILAGIKREVREYHYEDLIDLAYEAITLAIPKAALDSFGKAQLALDIEAGIKKHFLISDNEEFNQPIEKYMVKNIDAIMSDVEIFSENPLQR